MRPGTRRQCRRPLGRAQVRNYNGVPVYSRERVVESTTWVETRAGRKSANASRCRLVGKTKEVEAEVKRVQESGAWVEDGRICGVIAVSRAFGDWEWKGEGLNYLKVPANARRIPDQMPSPLSCYAPIVTVCTAMLPHVIVPLTAASLASSIGGRDARV